MIARKLRSQNHEEQREECIQYERLSPGRAGGGTQPARTKLVEKGAIPRSPATLDAAFASK